MKSYFENCCFRLDGMHFTVLSSSHRCFDDIGTGSRFYSVTSVITYFWLHTMDVTWIDGVVWSLPIDF